MRSSHTSLTTPEKAAGQVSHAPVTCPAQYDRAGCTYGVRRDTEKKYNFVS